MFNSLKKPSAPFVPAGTVPPRLLAVGTAVPPFWADQKTILAALKAHTPSSGTSLAHRVFSHPSVQKRHFAADSLESCLDKNRDRTARRFEKEATALSVLSLSRALDKAALSPRQIDCLVVATCTGFLCPGLAAHVAAAAHLKADVKLVDVVGMGCGAALPALEQAHHFLAACPGKRAAVICTEICSAAFYADDEPGVVISNALFGDGSATALLSSDPAGTHGPFFRRFASRLYPAWRDGLRFTTRDGYLKNVLAPEVPARAGRAMRALLPRLAAAEGLALRDIHHWYLHPGGEKVLSEAEKTLGLKPADVVSSREILKNHGNMSSPSCLFVLENGMTRRPPAPGEWGLLSSFGAGFSIHGALLQF